MYLQALSHALPDSIFTQSEVWEMLRSAPQAHSLKSRSLSLLEKILLGPSGIETRHIAASDPQSLFAMHPGELNAYFENHAPQLGCRALQNALTKAGLNAADIDALFVATCSGYLCPGPSSHIAEHVGLRDDCALTDLAGLGCGAAIPALRCASHYLAAHPLATVAVLAVEVCTAAFFLNDDPAVLISLCLFGDAASASLWRANPSNTSSGRLGGFHSLHLPEHREKIRFINDTGFLRNQLDRQVPALAGQAVARMAGAEGTYDRLICHPGGRDVLDAIESALPGYPQEASRAVLRHQGNCSSPSVMLALERDLNLHPECQERVLASFGAGFACHTARFSR